MWEFIHTSARHGLQPHTSGFCPVAWTNGLPPHLIPLLEQLSAYRFLYPVAEDPEGRRTPVEYSYRRIRYGGRLWPIAGRIAGTRLDYSGRLNRIAHLLILEEQEVPGNRVGAVAICKAEGNFRSSYEEAPKVLPLRSLQTAQLQPDAGVWADCALDPRWAGAVANHFLTGNGEPCYCLFSPGTSAETLLKIIGSVIALLPEKERRNFTFSTYYSQSTPGCECYFRCIAEGNAVPQSGLHLSLNPPCPVPTEWLPRRPAAAEPPPASPGFPAPAEEPPESGEPGNGEKTIRLPLPESSAKLASAISAPAPEKRAPESGTPFFNTSRNNTEEESYPPEAEKRKLLKFAVAVIAIMLAAAAIAVVQRRQRLTAPPAPESVPAPAEPVVRKTPPLPAPAKAAPVKPKKPAKPKTAGSVPRMEAPPSPPPQKTAEQKQTPETEPPVYRVRLSAEPQRAVWSFRKMGGAPELGWQDREVSAASYIQAVLREKENETALQEAEKKLEDARKRDSLLQKKAISATSTRRSKLKKKLKDQESEIGKLEKQLEQLQKNGELFRKNRIQSAKELRSQIERVRKLKGEMPTLAELLEEGGLPTEETEMHCEQELATRQKKGGGIHAEK